MAIWWILPALAGVIGLMLFLAGLGRITRLRPASGAVRLLFGVGFLGVAGIGTFAGLNLQTYKRLVYERPVAILSFEATGQPETFVATLAYPDGETDAFTLKGDEWALGARVIKFKPMGNLLGYDSVFKLDRLYGRFEDVARASETTGVRLSENPGLDVRAMAARYGARWGLQDASYGSEAYNPMDDGLRYDVSMTQSGLIARSANDRTRRRVGLPANPVAAPTGGGEN